MERQTKNPDRYRICQGDIFRKIYFIETVEELNVENLEIIRIKFPYVLLLKEELEQLENKNRAYEEYFKLIYQGIAETKKS